MLKFQAVAEKTAKNFRGLLFLPHPVYVSCVLTTQEHVQINAVEQRSSSSETN